MKTKTRAWLSVVLFLVIFAGLLITATFTDFQVSSILTSKALSEHTYLTSHPFGVAFEALGSDPVYIAYAFSFAILFWYFKRKQSLSSAPRTVLSVLMAIFAFAANYVMVFDSMGYIQEHVMMIEHSNLSTPAWMLLINIIVALAFWILILLAVRNFTDEQIQALFTFAVATLVFITVSTIILQLVKGPVGRIRFRAMNVAEADPKYAADYGFSQFARWYEARGQWVTKEDMLTIFGSTDALKSFPSGHTCAAGASYFMPMLNDALKIKNKGVRAFMWVCPVIITGTVAVSRIIVGAHFFSDVLVGGTCAFVCMILCREIFICKGSNVKAMFGKEA